MSEFMKADAALEADINKATSPEEIRQLLANAVERSNIGVTRDPTTGQYVKRETTPEVAAAAAAAAAPKEFNKVVSINGVAITFTGESVEEVDISIEHAKKVAALLHDEAVENQEAETAAEQAARVATDRAEADIAFRTGQITPKEYLERTGAVAEYLQDQGVDVAELSARQAVQGWQEASEIFKNSPAGDTWPGGERNQAILGLEIQALGLENATDKVAALAAGFASMKRKGIVFSTEQTAAQAEEETKNMSPAQIMERWKEGLGGDSERANAEFINIHSGGRLFDR